MNGKMAFIEFLLKTYHLQSWYWQVPLFWETLYGFPLWLIIFEFHVSALIGQILFWRENTCKGPWGLTMSCSERQCGILDKNTDTPDGIPVRFTTWPWASYIISRCFSFLFCKMEIMIVSAHRVCVVRMKWVDKQSLQYQALDINLAFYSSL